MSRAILCGVLAVGLAFGSAARVPRAAAAAEVPCNIVNGSTVGSQRVARLYKAVFHRAPDPVGWNYWKGVYANTSLLNIAGYFLQAPDFTNLYGSTSDREFVRLLYQNVLEREPDAQGYSYWIGRLESGQTTRRKLVVFFSESDEFKRRENDIYLEYCQVLAPRKPSAFFFSRLNVLDGSGQKVGDAHYFVTLDGADGSSSFVYTDGFDVQGFLGQRRPGEACVSWRTADYQAAKNTYLSADLSPANVRQLADDLRTYETGAGSGDSIQDRLRVFEDKIAAVDGPLRYTCIDEPAPIKRLAKPRFVAWPELKATSVSEIGGFVRRNFFLHNEELKALVAAGDVTLKLIVPFAEHDLQISDEMNAELRRAGLSDFVSPDNVSLSIDVWSDPTGNTSVMNGTYSVRLYRSDLSQWQWLTEIDIRRVPSTP